MGNSIFEVLLFKNYENMELQKTYSDSDKMSKLEIFVKNLYRPKHNFFEKVEKWKVDRMWRQVLALFQYFLINWKRLKLFRIWKNVQKTKIGRTKCQNSRFVSKNPLAGSKTLEFSADHFEYWMDPIWENRFFRKWHFSRFWCFWKLIWSNII